MKRVYIVDGSFYLAETLDRYNAYLLSKGGKEINPTIFEIPKDAIVRDIVNGQFSETAYNARKATDKQRRYESLVERYIRERYSLNAELAILRQRDTKPVEFYEYNEFAEQCKLIAKQEINK